MDDVEFANWLGGIARLGASQRLEALAALTHGEGGVFGENAGSLGSAAAPSRGRLDEDALQIACRARLENQGCPHCAGRRLVSWGSANGLPRFRCKNCARTFNGLTKTPMARLRNKPRWRANAEAMIAATTVARAAEIAEVHYTTAFRWRHRFLGAPALDKPKKLSGIVEAGETFMKESFKGRRSELDRRGGDGKAQVPEIIAVLIARDRQGATIDAVLPRLDAAAVGAALGGVVGPGNRLVCDGDPALCAFARNAKIPIDGAAPPDGRIESGQDHVGNVDAYRDRLQQWLRRFHGVATKNLPNYLGWRRALEAWGSDVSPANWILGAVGMGPYQESTAL